MTYLSRHVTSLGTWPSDAQDPGATAI